MLLEQANEVLQRGVGVADGEEGGHENWRLRIEKHFTLDVIGLLLAAGRSRDPFIDPWGPHGRCKTRFPLQRTRCKSLPPGREQRIGGVHE